MLADSTSESVGSALLKRWPQLTPAGKGQAVDLLLKRPAWTNALLDAVEKGGVDKADFSVEQAQRLSKYPDEAVSAARRSYWRAAAVCPIRIVKRWWTCSRRR